MADVPPLPPGFTLDSAPASGGSLPPLPPGFTLDSEQQEPVTALNRAGAFAAGFNRGVTGVAGLPVDTAANVRDLGKAIIGSIYGVITSEKGKPLQQPRHIRMFDVDEDGNLVPSRTEGGAQIPDALQITDRAQDVGSGEHLAQLLDKGSVAVLGAPATQAPRPDDKASRYLYAAGAGASSAALSPGRPVMPAVAGVTGSEAAQIAAEHGADPGTQALAGFAGSTVPGAARVTIAEGARRLARGGEEGRQRVAENIRAFEDAGTTPSVGQASEGRLARATESLLTRTPGAAGRMAAKADEQGQQIGSMVEKIANTLAPKASGEQAGLAIQRGVSGEGGFVSQFKAKQEQLYNALDQHIAKDTRVDVTNTAAALKELNADIPGAPNISEFFKNAKIKGIEGALKADTEGASALKARPDIPEFSGAKGAATPKADMDLAASLLNDGKLPYEALKKLRTLVGREMADSSIVSDVPRSKWTALYAALSKDLEGAATKAGPQASAAFNRANAYTRAGMRRLEVLDSVVDKAGGPEKIFQAATSGAKEGATTLRAVMQSLPEDAQKTLSASVLRRMGRATSGRQNDVGERFSTETFLTNWNSMSPQAKAALFNRFGANFRFDMDQIAKVASNLREGSAVFRNPSGTGQALTQMTAAGATVAAGAQALAGNFVPLAVVAGGGIGANLAARVMTNPRAVAWLAKTTKASQSALPALINQAAQSNDPDLRELAEALKKRPKK